MKGEDDLRRTLQRVQLGISDALADELERQAARIVARMKAAAPKETGKLAQSIGWTWGEAPKGSMTVGTVRRSATGPKITIFAGSRRQAGSDDKGAFYATWQEFGTVKMPAHPYFWPAYRATRQGLRSGITKALNRAAEAAK